MSHPPAGAPVVLDTSVIVAVIFEGVEHHSWGNDLCRTLKLQRHRIVFSSIIRVEYAQALRNLAVRTHQLPRETRDQFSLDDWATAETVREQWLADGVARLQSFLAQFDDSSEVPFDIDIWHESLDIMARYQLRSLDAIQVATATVVGVPDFASLDPHFRRITTLTLRSPPVTT